MIIGKLVLENTGDLAKFRSKVKIREHKISPE